MPTVLSVHPYVDVCGRWPGLWSQGDLLDSLICCKIFPDRHYMDEDSIAYVLGISYKGCAGMRGQDVADLYRFLLANPKLRSNPINYWIDILNRQMKHLMTGD